MSDTSSIFSGTRLQALTRPADRALRAAFEALASLPVPDHLLYLADELENARVAGNLRTASSAA